MDLVITDQRGTTTMTAVIVAPLVNPDRSPPKSKKCYALAKNVFAF
jgi:hypothetical protein